MSAAGRYDILAEHRARHSQGEQIDADETGVAAKAVQK